MTALARRVDVAPTPEFLLECLGTRAEARAYLVAEAEMDFHVAVDGLHVAAENWGLYALFGIDHVQAVMARAFRSVPR